MSELTDELLAAIRDVCQRHDLRPGTAAGAITIVTALGHIMMAVARAADHGADGIVISSKDDGVGTLVTVHSDGDSFSVHMPKEMMQ